MNKEELFQKQRYLTYLPFPVAPLHLSKAQTQMHETHLPKGKFGSIFELCFFWSHVSSNLDHYFLVMKEIYCLNKEQTTADFIDKELTQFISV